MLRFALVFAFSLLVSQALYINFEGKKEYCFYVMANEGVNLTISYVVSGYNEHLVALKVFFLFLLKNKKIFMEIIIYFGNTKVFSPTNLLLKTIEMQKEQFFDIYIAESGKQKICFMNLDGASKILAFDFMEAEKRKEAEIATKGAFFDIFNKFSLNLWGCCRKPGKCYQRIKEKFQKFTSCA